MFYNCLLMLFITAFSLATLTTPVNSERLSKGRYVTDTNFFTTTQYSQSLKDSDNKTSEILEVRSFLIDKNRHWPLAIVPYEIDPSFNLWERGEIGRALALFHQTTCIRFVPHTTEHDYIRYTRSASQCSSSLGRLGGRQHILLDDDCFYLPGYRGSVLHETMHSLGFIHEHQRTDRDCYVWVTGKGLYLQDYRYIPGTDTRFPYDLHSIMHYREKYFLKSRNGEKLGNPMCTLTDMDKQKLNYVYCGWPHYCRLHPLECEATERATRFCRVYL